MNALQDNPLQAVVVSQPGIPILGGLDMWEHSYYLKCASYTYMVMQAEMSSKKPQADEVLFANWARDSCRSATPTPMC